MIHQCTKSAYAWKSELDIWSQSRPVTQGYHDASREVDIAWFMNGLSYGFEAPAMYHARSRAIVNDTALSSIKG